MTGRERMLKTLRFEEPDRPPHFEVMFELEKEVFGLEFPDRRVWGSCTATEKVRLIGVCMRIYEKIVERYGWDALLVFWPWSDPDGVRAAKATFGDDILVGSVVGGTIHSIEGMTDWLQLEAIRASARYCLEHGTPGGGYIFGTSNTIFPGMPIEHYEYMVSVYREFCAEPAQTQPAATPRRRSL